MTPSMRDSVDDLAGVPQGSPLGWVVTVALVLATLVAMCGETHHRPSTPSVPDRGCGSGVPSPSHEAP